MDVSFGPGRTLFAFVRFWSRRWTGAGQAIEAERGRDVMVTEAVANKGQGGASINEISTDLGIDQSNASRLVASAVAHGYLSKRGSPDARKRLVVVSPEGHALIAHAHAWQEEVFGELTVGWSPQEVQQFTTLMTRLCDAASARFAAQISGSAAPP